MILKMVEIHQRDYIDDISKEFVDGGDRSIQSLLRHSVPCLCVCSDAILSLAFTFSSDLGNVNKSASGLFTNRNTFLIQVNSHL